MFWYSNGSVNQKVVFRSSPYIMKYDDEFLEQTQHHTTLPVSFVYAHVLEAILANPELGLFSIFLGVWTEIPEKYIILQMMIISTHCLISNDCQLHSQKWKH